MHHALHALPMDSGQVSLASHLLLNHERYYKSDCAIGEIRIILQPLSHLRESPAEVVEGFCRACTVL